MYNFLKMEGSVQKKMDIKLTMMGWETVNQNFNSRCSSSLQVVKAIY